ncbi:MAG TPA: CBS domain-containing protein [Alphaproteobacteria bacterium]|jgi:CBS domain-containing protein|nr:CBS domain-containing protein [Alphaproteobacteria bacterium]
MSVGQILKTKGQRVITVKTSAKISEVVATLNKERIGAVIVSDDDVGVAGIVSERDLIRGLADHGAKMLDMKTGELMTGFTPAKADMPLLHVLDLMTKGRFRHMPVMEGSRLTGLVSIGDAVKARLDALEHEAAQMKDYIAGR